MVQNQKMNLFFGALQCLILMITVFISIFKPWKKKKVKLGAHYDLDPLDRNRTP